MEKGVFVPVQKFIADGHRISESRFVDTMKNKGTPISIQNYAWKAQGFNSKHLDFMTHAPTVQRCSRRRLFLIALMFPDWNICICDVAQAYTQSTTKLQRKICAESVPEFKLSSNMILQITLPLLCGARVALRKARLGDHVEVRGKVFILKKEDHQWLVTVKWPRRNDQ